MKELKTLQYFSESIIDPIHEVFRVLDNVNHQEYEKLLSDLESIEKDELTKYIEDKNIDFFIRDVINIDLERRAYFLANLLHLEIARERLNTLLDTSSRPKPYNSNNLNDVSIDNSGLVNISDFNLNRRGITYSDFGYRLCPSTDTDNSSYWVFLEIASLATEKLKSFKIRLDPFIEKPITEYNPMMFKMTVYGKPLDWEGLKNLKSDDYGQFMNEKDYGDYGNTDYVWRVERDELHFTCEELPKVNKCEYRGSRYFHAIFDKKTGNIIHCDGAIRIYNEIELTNRMQVHVRNTEARKVGKRVKIFQTNDNLNHEDFTKLVVSFFVWNDDIRLYFN